jgi:hypothetical protein
MEIGGIVFNYSEHYGSLAGDSGAIPFEIAGVGVKDGVVFMSSAKEFISRPCHPMSPIHAYDFRQCCGLSCVYFRNDIKQPACD